MSGAPLNALRYHVSGAIARGEQVAVTEKRARVRSFWDYSPFAFSPRVKPIGRAHIVDGPFDYWRVLVRVTGRGEAHVYHNCKTGKTLWTNVRSLYADRRVIPRTFGRLEYSGPMSRAEFDALPIVSAYTEESQP